MRCSETPCQVELRRQSPHRVSGGPRARVARRTLAEAGRLGNERDHAMAVKEETIGVTHPLEPLTADEIGRAGEIVRSERNLRREQVRFISVSLHEPPKDAVLGFTSDSAVEREAFVILLDRAQGYTYDAIVSLTSGRITAWRHVPDTQPNIVVEE